MAFKMVTESEKAAGRIASTALAFAESIAEEQAAKWRHRSGDEQPVLDVEAHQRCHAEELLRLREELLEAERAHLDRLQEIAEARARRNAAVPRLRAVLYAVRDVFQGIYGDKGPAALFLERKPKVPVDVTPLRRVGRRVVAKLRDESLELPPPILRLRGLSRRELAEDVEQPLEALEAAMQELEELLPLANETLERKQRAHAAVDRKSARLARYLEALYELEGHAELAARVRQSSHRKKEAESAGAVAASAEDEEAAEVSAASAEPVAASAIAESRHSGPGLTVHANVDRGPTAGPIGPPPVATRALVRRAAGTADSRRRAMAPAADGRVGAGSKTEHDAASGARETFPASRLD